MLLAVLFDKSFFQAIGPRLCGKTTFFNRVPQPTTILDLYDSTGLIGKVSKQQVIDTWCMLLTFSSTQANPPPIKYMRSIPFWDEILSMANGEQMLLTMFIEKRIPFDVLKARMSLVLPRELCDVLHSCLGAMSSNETLTFMVRAFINLCVVLIFSRLGGLLPVLGRVARSIPVFAHNLVLLPLLPAMYRY